MEETAKLTRSPTMMTSLASIGVLNESSVKRERSKEKSPTPAEPVVVVALETVLLVEAAENNDKWYNEFNMKMIFF